MKKYAVTAIIILAFIVATPSQSDAKLNNFRFDGDQAPTVFILCYHTFIGYLGKKKIDTDISEQMLDDQLNAWKNAGFSFVSWQDIVNGTVRGHKNILITVDDGNVTVYDTYRKVLKAHEIKPVLAIYPAIIGKVSYALTWDQLAELAADGAEIAAHGWFHLYVNAKLYKNDKTSFMREIFKPKEVLEEKLKKPVTIFVYPYGSKSDITVDFVKKAGYLYAMSLAESLMFTAAPPVDSWRYRIPRYMVTKSNFNGVFKAINALADSPDKLMILGPPA